MVRETVILDDAITFFREEVAPIAQRMDTDSALLREALEGMGRRQMLALKRPEEWGGPDLHETAFRRFQEEIARVSGALAFLQTQHQSAASMIARSENETLKKATLPFMADGSRLIGIGFSQLRRSGPPIMKATKVDGGYELTGLVPWVTGWTFYPEFLIGATLPDGTAVFGIVPLPTDPHPHIKVSEPMKLSAMQSAMTVAVEFDSFFMPNENVAFLRPVGWIQNNDMINIALQGSFAMGCSQGSLDILQANASKKREEFLVFAHQAMSDELCRCRERAEELRHVIDEETLDDRLALRAWQIELAVRCAHAAVASSGGSAISMDHPAQRLMREAMVYSVSAQTPAIMKATLERVASRSS